MNLKSMAHQLGGEVSGGQVLAPGPGHSPGDRSMSVRVDPNAPEGFLAFSFAGDSWQACRDHVKARLGISAAAPVQPQRREPARPAGRSDVERTAGAMAIWNEASKSATLLDAYLASRGIHRPDDVRQADVLRFHADCPFRLDDGSTARLPAMVALMRDIITNEPTGVHRTALKPDGSGKAEVPGLGNPKKMLGRAKGAVVKLSADEDVLDGLGIVEGIETGLAVMAAGWRPIWAALSAGAIRDFPVLPGVECLTIFADADPTGLAAARACQQRWKAVGQECPIVLPPHEGTDWNDWRRST